MVKSPCINTCSLNDDMICIGCYRHIDEIDSWDKLSDDKKIEIKEELIKRRKKYKGDDYYGFP